MNTGTYGTYTDLVDPNRKWYNNKRSVQASNLKYYLALKWLLIQKSHYPQLVDFSSVTICHLCYILASSSDFFTKAHYFINKFL